MLMGFIKPGPLLRSQPGSGLPWEELQTTGAEGSSATPCTEVKLFMFHVYSLLCVRLEDWEQI